MFRSVFLLPQGTTCTLQKLLCRKFSSKVIVLDNISCFGSLILRCPFNSAFIDALDPHKVPNGDKAFIHIKVNEVLEDLSKFYDVNYCASSSTILITYADKLSDSKHNEISSIHIRIPHNYSIHAEAGNINVGETEGHILKLLSHNDCSLGKIKSMDTDVKSHGDLDCKNFQGNGTLSADGNLTIGKIQSNDIIINSGNNVSLSAVYSQHFNCKSCTGDINIENLHGDSKIESKSGKISIASSSGDLNIKTESGNIDVAIENTDICKILSKKGDICVGFSDSVSTSVEGEAEHLDIPEDLFFDGMKSETSEKRQYFEGKIGDGKSSVIVTSKHGAVSFSRVNWFSKFNLQD